MVVDPCLGGSVPKGKISHPETGVISVDRRNNGETLVSLFTRTPTPCCGGHQQQCRRSRRAADPGQAGDYLRTDARFIRRLIAVRRISYVKLGKHVWLQRSALDAF